MNDGGPAFPQADYTGNLEDWKHGMSLRDWFAVMAAFQEVKQLAEFEDISFQAARYLIADRMLSEREKGK